MKLKLKVTLTSSNIGWCHQFLCYKEMSKNSNNLMKLVNIEEENLCIFWTTWVISMKFSGKIWIVIILQVTKKQGSLSPSLSRSGSPSRSQMVSTLVSTNFSSPRLGHTIKANCTKNFKCWSRDMLNFYFLEKIMGLVSPSHLAYHFLRKIFLMLHSMNWPDFIV